MSSKKVAISQNDWQRIGGCQCSLRRLLPSSPKPNALSHNKISKGTGTGSVILGWHPLLCRIRPMVTFLYGGWAVIFSQRWSTHQAWAKVCQLPAFGHTENCKLTRTQIQHWSSHRHAHFRNHWQLLDSFDACSGSYSRECAFSEGLKVMGC
jgi:hypothetical protein